MQNIFDQTTSTQKPKKYGITEKKKAELDELTSEVTDAQHDVDQYQAMVNSLIEKSMKLERFLSDANSDQAKTLSNQNMVDNLVQSAKDLLSNSKITFEEMGKADSKTGTLANQIQAVINKLIYSADIINKLAILVVRKKGRNPLI